MHGPWAQMWLRARSFDDVALLEISGLLVAGFQIVDLE